jgi:Tfp pilus assembly protein PilF
VNAKPKGAGLWILGPWQDLGLFVLSPLWIIPMLWWAKGEFDPNGFGAMLLAIGGTGHHLPGFIRAYTDPVLFRRFRMRFILAPLFLLGVYILFSVLHLESLKLILVLWGTWHGAMQVNGFLRIYDAKAGSVSTVTSWLDWAMCLGWFGGALFYSSRLIAILTYLFGAGVREIPVNAFVDFRNAWMIALAGITVAFLFHALRQARLGKGPNPVKLLMMASSFGLWWFAMVGVNSILVGLLLFELVHDLQYNVLVWHYNRRRVSRRMTASALERFLFRRKPARMFLYVMLVVAYGGIADVLGYANVQAPSALQISIDAVGFWTGLFIVSTFLHFYFDGFIWQVRDKDFREGIGIAEDRPRPPVGWSANRGRKMRLPVGWKWAFFVIPLTVLGISEYRKTEVPLVDQARNVAELIPGRWQANAVAGSLEKASGHEDRAIEYLKRAVALNPSYAYGQTMLADIYFGQGQSQLALEHYRLAEALNPRSYEVQRRLGKMLINEGLFDEAIPHLQIAAEHFREDADLAYVLGASLVQQKNPLDGIPHLLRAVELDPRQKQAFNYLGIAFQTQGDILQAVSYYRKALEIDPRYVAARENLGRLEQLLASTK